MKNKIFYLIIFLVLVAFIFSYGFSKKEEVVKAEMIKDSSNNEKKENIKENKTKENENDELIKVDIKGAVKKPGVYEISSKKRVIDVISLAGGLSNNANTNYVNLSTKLKDEMVIWIYTNDDISKLELEKSSVKYMVKECNCPTVDNTTCLNNDSEKEQKKDSSVNKLVDINKASIEELTTLSGIGEGKAKQIIEYREKNGNFKTIDDIKNVSGIGEALYNKIKSNIKV